MTKVIINPYLVYTTIEGLDNWYIHLRVQISSQSLFGGVEGMTSTSEEMYTYHGISEFD
jgi:hypothetical protein